MNHYDFFEIFHSLVMIAFVIIGLIFQARLIWAAFTNQGKSFGKAVVATGAWLALSISLFSIFSIWGFAVGFSGKGQIPFVVGFLFGIFSYRHAGKLLCAWARRDQAT